MANDLAPRQGSTERFTLPRPTLGEIESPTRRRVRLDGDAEPFSLKLLHDLQKPAVCCPHQVLSRYANVDERQLGGVATSPSHLVQPAGHFESRRILVDHEQ